jgi:hypothetical protein
MASTEERDPKPEKKPKRDLLTARMRRLVRLFLILVVVAAAAAALVWWLATSGMGATMLQQLAPDRPGRALVLLGFVAAAVVLGSAAAYWQGERYIASLLLVAPYLPGLAATVTVIAYITIGPRDPTSTDAAYFGLVFGFGAWPFLAWPLRGLTTADRAQSRSYLEVLQRHQQLKDRLDKLRPEIEKRVPKGADCPPDDPCLEAATVHLEAFNQLEYAAGLLGLPDHTDPSLPPGQPPRRERPTAIRWVTGSGYVEVARAMHRVEEALIEIEPIEALIGDALHDDLSLSDSTIQDSGHLRDLIRVAIQTLDPTVAARVFPDTRAGQGPVPPASMTLRAARPILREVRFALNDFRDKAKLGLVTAKVNLLWAILFVATGAYLLVGLAVLSRITREQLVASTVFFLVGAVVGLFNRLRIEGGRPTAVADFGLYQARLLHTPIVSGLAAVAGVFIVAVSPSFFAALGAASTAATAKGLPEIFNLAENPSGLLVAAIFGLAPANLTRTLGDQGAALERALSRSEPATSTEAT